MLLLAAGSISTGSLLGIAILDEKDRLIAQIMISILGESEFTTATWLDNIKRETMEIKTIPFEDKLLIIKNGQKIILTPFLTSEIGNIKIGIEAPRGIEVNREEIYKRKQEKLNECKL